MENLGFNELDQTPVGATEVADPKKAVKKERTQKLNAALKATLTEDPAFVQKANSLSASVQVVNTLGFGESGNLVVKEGTTERELAATSKIVGYAVQNTGTAEIPYRTETFKKNAEGVYEGTVVQKVLAPGETIALSRKFMTMFCAIPEISFTLANGKIIRGPGVVKETDIDGELEAYYFSFDDKDLKVNDDSIKLNVGQQKKVDGVAKWVVRKEYEGTFGYLNNPKPAGKRGRGAATGPKFNTQHATANFVNRLIHNAL